MLCNTEAATGITMSRMTSKGQVTIPKRMRDHLGLKPGSEVTFEYAGDGQIIIKALDGKKKRLTEAERLEAALAQLRGSAGPGMSTDELMRLTRGWGEADYDVK